MIAASPMVMNLAPQSGISGTTVSIRGRTFTSDDPTLFSSVKMGSVLCMITNLVDLGSNQASWNCDSGNNIAGTYNVTFNVKGRGDSAGQSNVWELNKFDQNFMFEHLACTNHPMFIDSNELSYYRCVSKRGEHTWRHKGYNQRQRFQ